jgi:hypothetical protein
MNDLASFQLGFTMFPCDSSFSIPEIDIMGYNAYPYGRIDRTSSFQQDVNLYQNLYNKPVYFAETGELGTNICDDGNYYEQLLWQLPFTGVCGFNFWDGNKLSYIPQWQEMTKLKNWILNDPMKTETLLGDFWVMNSKSEITPPATLFHKEMSYIARRTNQGLLYGQPLYIFDYAFGALHNMTDNYLSYNQEVNIGYDCYNKLLNSAPEWYKISAPNNINGISQNWDLLTNKINLDTYTKPLYNVFPIQPFFEAPIPTRFRKIDDIDNFEEIPWLQNGGLPFQHPNLCVENSCLEKTRTYAFESLLFPITTWGLMDNHEPFLEEKSKESIKIVQENEKTTLEHEHEIDNFCKLFIYDVTGRLMKQEITTEIKISERDLDGLSSGVYVIRFYSNTNQLIFQSCVTIH